MVAFLSISTLLAPRHSGRVLGAHRTLHNIENTNMKTKNASDWNHTLVVIAWAAFLISFFLPSYAEGRGYQCAALHSFFWSGAMEGNWGSIHYLLLTLANLLMLISPFLLLRCR